MVMKCLFRNQRDGLALGQAAPQGSANDSVGVCDGGLVCMGVRDDGPGLDEAAKLQSGVESDFAVQAKASVCACRWGHCVYVCESVHTHEYMYNYTNTHVYKSDISAHEHKRCL